MTSHSDHNLSHQGLPEDVAVGIRRLFERYHNDIYNLCYRMVAHPEDAEDIASDVFARAFKGYDRFRSEASPGTWLYRIAVNLCLNHQRRRKYLKWMSFDFWEEEFDELPFESPEKKPDEIMESKDVERLVHRALQELPPAQRAAITLARYENLTSREIAEVMGRSVSSVESLLIRAKKNLARSLQPSLKDL